MAKQNHQPFETWIFSEETLSASEAQALQAHLQHCEDCRQLSNAWQEVETQFRLAPPLKPAPGFTQRWQVRLAADQRRAQRWQTLSILLFSVGGAMLLFVLLGMTVFPLLRSPVPVAMVLVYQLTVLVSQISGTASVLITVVDTLIGVVPPSLWAGIGVALSLLFALWVVSLRKLTVTRRISP